MKLSQLEIWVGAPQSKTEIRPKVVGLVMCKWWELDFVMKKPKQQQNTYILGRPSLASLSAPKSETLLQTSTTFSLEENLKQMADFTGLENLSLMDDLKEMKSHI